MSLSTCGADRTQNVQQRVALRPDTSEDSEIGGCTLFTLDDHTKSGRARTSYTRNENDKVCARNCIENIGPNINNDNNSQGGLHCTENVRRKPHREDNFTVRGRIHPHYLEGHGHPHGYHPRPDMTSRSCHRSDFLSLQSNVYLQEERWRIYFNAYDQNHTGEITIDSLQKLLRDPRFYMEMDNHTIEVLQMKCADPERHTMSYQELINLMSNKRTPSFRLAVEEQGKEEFQCYNRSSPTLFQRMVRRVAKGYLTDDLDRQYYSDRYSCCPPPVFIPVISLVEVGLFIYHCLDAGSITSNGPIPVDSFLIYRPDKRIELWRFLLYMFIHAGWVHLFFNILVQIVVGVPLEMVHGSCRLMAVYMAGVVAGSLGTSVFDMKAYLVGASGGVYALLAAHLANIMLNYSQMELGLLKLGAVLIVASADVGFAVWDRYSDEDKGPPVGYTAHLMGALAGLTVGLLVLKNFEQKLHEQYIWWIALAVYLGCTVFAVCWNIFYY